MYVSHKPEDHDDIMVRRYRDKRSTTAAQSSGAGGESSNGSNLVINQKLKEVLCSKLSISDANVDNIWKNVCSKGKDKTKNMGCMVF